MDSLPDQGPKVFNIGIRLMDENAIAEPGVVWKRVDAIFTQFCQSPSNSFSRACAFWMTEAVDPASLKPHEVLVYLVRNRSASLAAVVAYRFRPAAESTPLAEALQHAPGVVRV
jgi:hypothetical protein